MLDVIRNNRNKYPIVANVFYVESEATYTMCDVLDIPRSNFYYKPIEKPCEDKLVKEVQKTFKESRNNYGKRKIKVEL